MTTGKTPGSGSLTADAIDELAEHLEVIQNLPAYMRGKVAVRVANLIVLALRDLDRRIQQLEISASDEQNDRHGDLPTVRRASSGSQK